MLHTFPLADLAWPCVFILVVGLLISYAFTRRIILSYWIAVLKAGMFLLYFGFFFDGTFTALDDWTYLHIGELFARNHVGITNVFGHYQYVVGTITAANVAYYVYNATAVRIFGYGYYAPVAVNVVLTFLAAGLLMKAARVGLGMSRRVSIGLFACLALAPDIVVWSTIPNMKDTLVATATAAAVYAITLVDEHRLVRATVLAVAAAVVLAFTRLYVPLMLGIAFGITLFLSPRGRRNPLLWVLAAIALAEVARVMGHGSFVGGLHSVRSKMDNPVLGVLRFLVTPVPFHTAPSYAYLDIPQLVYWILLPCMVYGIFTVWRRATLTARFMVIYFLIMILLYGSFTTLQGPRHRVQVDGLITIFQYYGILALLRGRFRLRSRRFSTAAPDRADAESLYPGHKAEPVVRS